MSDSDKQLKPLHILALPFYAWVLTNVNIVNRKSCGCKSNVVTGINIMTGLQIFVSISFIIATSEPVLYLLMIAWYCLSTINFVLYFVFFTQIKNQNCMCYRKYKGTLIALLVFIIIVCIRPAWKLIDDIIGLLYKIINNK